MWRYAVDSKLGGTCLDGLSDETDDINSIFYPFVDYYKMRAKKDDWEALHASLPPIIRSYNESNGFTYQWHDTCTAFPESGGVTIASTHSSYINTSAKEIHWAINYVRMLAERPDRWCVLRHAIDAFKVDITPFEQYILAHSIAFTSYNIGDIPRLGMVGEYVADQTMLNGWKVGQNLRIILSRLYDILREDRTEVLCESYDYWCHITNDSSDFVSVPIVDAGKFMELTSFKQKYALPYNGRTIPTDEYRKTEEKMRELEAAAHILRLMLAVLLINK
jgi:hypothetical protein